MDFTANFQSHFEVDMEFSGQDENRDQIPKIRDSLSVCIYHNVAELVEKNDFVERTFRGTFEQINASARVIYTNLIAEKINSSVCLCQNDYLESYGKKYIASAAKIEDGESVRCNFSYRVSGNQGAYLQVTLYFNLLDEPYRRNR